MAGRRPTKEALLAISICMGQPIDKISILLGGYGYYLSRSLPNDSIALWFLKKYNGKNQPVFLLESINEVLASLELPILMTKPIKR